METVNPVTVPASYADRTLLCADCRAEFIFTAGEQLFFMEKQFKNDPKRCKPCKSRRSGLSAAANGLSHTPAGLSRTETRTECSECGVDTTVPFKPTQGRPVLCRHCFQLKSRAVAAAQAELAAAVTPDLTNTEAISVLTEASVNTYGAILSADAAVLALASISAAPAFSSVATAEDLAAIASLGLHGTESHVTPELLAAAAEAPAA